MWLREPSLRVRRVNEVTGLLPIIMWAVSDTLLSLWQWFLSACAKLCVADICADTHVACVVLAADEASRKCQLDKAYPLSRNRL